MASLCWRASAAVSSLHASAHAHALHLVGRDLLAVAGAADDHAQAARVGDHGRGRPQAEHRVVVEGVIDERAVVDRLVALLAQPAGQVLLELEAGVVGAEVHAHTGSLVSVPTSRASSSSTTAGSSLVNTGVGFATGVPTATGRRSQRAAVE